MIYLILCGIGIGGYLLAWLFLSLWIKRGREIKSLKFNAKFKRDMDKNTKKANDDMLKTQLMSEQEVRDEAQKSKFCKD